MRAFVDTSLWVYRLNSRAPDRFRIVAQRLRRLGDEHDVVISTQVMIELRAVLARKLQPAYSNDDICAALEALVGFEVLDTHACQPGAGRLRAGKHRATILVRRLGR